MIFQSFQEVSPKPTVSRKQVEFPTTWAMPQLPLVLAEKNLAAHPASHLLFPDPTLCPRMQQRETAEKTTTRIRLPAITPITKSPRLRSIRHLVYKFHSESDPALLVPSIKSDTPQPMSHRCETFPILPAQGQALVHRSIGPATDRKSPVRGLHLPLGQR